MGNTDSNVPQVPIVTRRSSIFVVLSSEVRVRKTVLAGAACICQRSFTYSKGILDHWDGPQVVLQFGGRDSKFERGRYDELMSHRINEMII